MDYRVNVRQINLNKSKNAYTELELLMHKQNRTIILVQEPALCRGKVLALANFKTISSHSARAAIYVSRDLDATPIAKFLTNDLVLCQVKRSSGGIIFGSIYCDILKDDFSLIEEARMQTNAIQN